MNSNRIITILLTFLLVLASLSSSYSQTENLSHKVNWDEPILYGFEGDVKNSALSFENAQYDFSQSALPFLYLELGSFGNKKVSDVSLINIKYELLSKEENEIVEENVTNSDFTIEIENSIIQRSNHSFLKLKPIRLNNQGQLEKLISFDYQLTFDSERLRRDKSLTFSTQSLLSNGNWYKIAVTQDKVYKLNYNFLKKLGMDVDQLDPRDLRLFGYGGGMLPEANSVPRPDDMQENAIFVGGEADGRFNTSDFVLFYGEDQVSWSYDTSNSKDLFVHRKNIYSDTTYYFITADLGRGQRIVKETRPTLPISQTVTEFDDYDFHEADNINLLNSGQLWFGEAYDNQLAYNYSFSFPDINLQEEAKVLASVAARSGVISTFTLSNGASSKVIQVGSVALNNYAFAFARTNELRNTSQSVFKFNPTASSFNINVSYNKPQSVSQGWMNYLTVNVRRKLILSGNQLAFRDSRSFTSGGINPATANEFLISGMGLNRVWDISDRYNIVEKDIRTIGNTASIIADNSMIREFVALRGYDSTNVTPLGMVSNQNLHGMPQADMVIVTHPTFINQANRLASFHEEEGLAVNVVTTNQVYNEFSSGSQDLIAIRTFMKMFYDRALTQQPSPKYLLLFGDGSFAFKNKINGNTNKVPAYQSTNSLDPVDSYVSDDYVALLDDSEGLWRLGTSNPDKLDLGVGRIPVNTVQEAEGVVNKIVSYYGTNTLRDWRNSITFVADDEDGTVHMTQSNELSKILDDDYQVYNHKKIFLDAFQQESVASGNRYPEANKSINAAVQRGTLFMNYTGHGGETGWAGERVLGVSDIFSWNNKANMPIFVTATCEFSRFDDPFRQSAGEMVLTNPAGGGVALMTTTRLVYSSPNYVLNRTFYNKVFQRKANGETKRIGDVFQEVKNVNASIGNTRNFSLLGDPALRIAIPQNQTIVTKINGKSLGQLDTLNALSKATIEGFVADVNGNKINDFNGFIYPTIFDKIIVQSTLNQENDGVFTYDDRESKIFTGKASVVNGEYSYSFIVPKDISYSYGEGKISHYAQNGITDANGYSTDFIIGGSNPNAITDQEGPSMDLYMNDESFVYGGITNDKPILLVKLEDSLGINTVGNGIGHDLVAVLDGNTEEALILNDYYEAALDDYTKGEIRYPIEGLSEGKHTLRVKAWDVANNSSEKTIEFNVVGNREIEIDNLLNYPNPFTTNTEFIFQHNQAGVPLDVKLEIFTVSGKLVKSFNEVVVNDGFISRDIRWNGRDDFGDKIGKGVYVYKIKVRSRNGSSTEKFEKLVIL